MIFFLICEDSWMLSEGDEDTSSYITSAHYLYRSVHVISARAGTVHTRRLRYRVPIV